MRCYHPAFVQVIGVVLLAPLGCAGTGMMSWMHNDMPKASAKNPAVKIVCIWEPAEGQGVNGLPTRGFAGQIFFFTRNSSPAQVDGAVRIYLFDDQGSVEEQGKPIHQFDFLGDAWTAHLSNSMLGPSYNVFVPYVGRNLWQTNCSLRVRFIPQNGPTIYSDIVHVLLPGPDKTTENQPSQKSGLQVIEKTNDLSAFSLGSSLKRQQLPVSPIAISSRPLPATSMATESPFLNEPRRLGKGRLGKVRTTQADVNRFPISSRQPFSDRDPRQADDSEDAGAQQFERMFQQPQQTRRPPSEEHPPVSAPGKKPRRFRLTSAQADAHSDFDQPNSSGSAQNHPSNCQLQTTPHPLQDFKKRVHPLAQD